MAVVSTADGKLAGIVRGRHHAFLGVPFAEPPVGVWRWRAAQPHDGWTGTRNATDFATSARQTTHQIGGFAASGPQDEDCLYLNVYTPAPDASRRPVMLWIHGGGFTHGSGSEALYNGRSLVERGDVVVVTIHYRLGAFGFLALDGIAAAEHEAAPNAGLTDIVQALRWVQTNIEAFGGDPANVTIFGESAGSGAVGCLLAMPSARGLFHRAVMESGAGLQSPTREDAERSAGLVLRELGLDSASAGRAWDIDADALLEAQTRALKAGAGFRPAVDGAVLPVNPYDSLAAGNAAGIPYLVGSNRDEVKLFNAARDRVVDDTALLKGVRRALPRATDDDARALVEVHRASRRALGLSDDNVDLLDAVETNARFTVPTTKWAAAQAAHSEHAHRYLFTWESPARRGILGSCHALEMPFVFGTLDAPTQDRFAGTGPEAERLSAQMMDAWLSFAHTGNPAHEGIGAWPSYDATHPTMVFGRESGLEADPFASEREAVEQLL